MRLAVILPALDGGGIERMRIHLMEEWVRQGIEVDLVVGRFAGPLCERVPKGIQTFEVARHSPFSFPLGLWSYVKKRRPSHILSAGHDINAVTLTVSNCLRYRGSVAVSAHSLLSNELSLNKGLQRLKAYFVLWTLRRAIHPSHAVIAVSQGVAKDLKLHLPLCDEQLHVVYNPTITPKIKARLHEPLKGSPVPNGKPCILYVGRFVYQKNVDALVDAFQQLSSRSNAHLVLMGEGPLKKDIANLINRHDLQHRVHIVDFQDNPMPWIRHADVLALPSRYEGLPNVLIEALASGTQIVATDCPSGPAEILEDGKYGQLVPVENPIALAQAILNSLSGRHFVPSSILQERARHFTAQKAANRYYEILTDHEPDHRSCGRYNEADKAK